MMMHDRIEGIAFVLAAALVETVGQLAFKRAADGAVATQVRGDRNGISAYLAERNWFLVGIAAFAIEGIIWTCALKFLPVTVAQPVATIELVVVAILARIFLRERISPRRWAGIAFIFAGVVLVGAV